MNPDMIRVLIVDDHRMVRAGIISFLDEFEDIAVVGEAGNGIEAVEKTKRLTPDVVLLDLVMPEMDGIQATRRIKLESPETHVLALTSYCTDDLVFSALKAGAVGYLLKDSDPWSLVRAIREACRGKSSLHPSAAQKLIRGFQTPREPCDDPAPLTRREIEVLELVAQGRTDQEIASSLDVSTATVRTHVSNILARLHLDNRVQAALYALRSGIASTGEGP